MILLFSLFLYKNTLLTNCVGVLIQLNSGSSERMSLYLHINSQTGVPAYRQIMEQLSEYRRAGVLKAGEKLPSIRQLAKQLAVNPGTVVKAYHELEHADEIYSLHGKGVFAAEIKETQLSKKQREKSVRELSRKLWRQAQRMDLNREPLKRIIEEEFNHLEDNE